MIELSLPYPPSVNRYWRHIQLGRLGARVVLSKEAREYRATILSQMVSAGCLHVPGRVSVAIEAYPPDARRRDLDNICKALLDSLVHAGLIEDDSMIDDLRVSRGESCPGGRVMVTISKMGAV